MRTIASAAMLPVLALTCSAIAQPFDGRAGFRNDHVRGEPNVGGGPYVVAGPGVYNFALCLGAFDAQGVTNYGMFNWNRIHHPVG